MDLNIFYDLGLRRAETAIYLALIELGETTAGPILKKTGLQNSVTHMALNSLVEKGFASYILKGKVRYYTATDPKNIINFIDERKKRFESIMPELKVMCKAVETQEAEIYEGFRGFKSMLYEFINDAKRGDEYLFFAFYTENPNYFDNVYNFYKEFDNERAKRGIVLKGLSPSTIKKKFKGRNIKNIKFVNFPIPTNISIFRNKVVFTPWQDKQISFLIYSRSLADSLKKYFYSVYDN